MANSLAEGKHDYHPKKRIFTLIGAVISINIIGYLLTLLLRSRG